MLLIIIFVLIEKIFLIKLYSANSSVDYQIVYLDDAYKSLGYKINDFIIKRKD